MTTKAVMTKDIHVVGRLGYFVKYLEKLKKVFQWP